MRAAGRRPRGILLPQGGLSSGDAPPILFLFLTKRECAAPGGREKIALGALRCSGPPRAAGVGVSVQAPIWADLRARYSLLRGRYYRPVADGADLVGVVVVLPQHLFSLPLTLPCGRASGSENRRRMYPKLPRDGAFPKGRAFPSLTSTRECQPSPAGGRRSAPAQTDPPNIFSFPPGAAHFLFDVSKRKWGAHPAWTMPPAGADTPEAAVRRPIYPHTAR